MSLWQRSLMGMLSGAGSVVIKTGLNIVVVPVLLAQLGLEVFGLYVLLLAVLEIAMLLDFGASSALVKLVGGALNNVTEKRAILKVGHTLFALIALLFLGTGFLLADQFVAVFHITPALKMLARIGFLLTILEAAIAIYGCYLHAVLLAHCAHQWNNIADTLYYFVANVGALILLALGYDLTAILAVRLLGAIARVILLIVKSAQVEPDAFLNKAPFKIATFKEVTHLGAHAMMINFCIIISHKIDGFVIARFLPLSAVGIYEIVFRLLGITITICLKLSEGAFPLFAGLATERKVAEARQLFLRLSSFLNLVALLMVTLIVTFYPELFDLFSAHQIAMTDTLPILLLTIPCILSGVLQMPAGAWLFTWGHQKFLSISSILAALANFVLSLILVQYLGIVGVALGTLIPQLLQHQAGLIAYTCRKMGIRLREYMGAVHGAMLIPVAAALVWALLWRPVVAISTWPILTIALVAGSAMLLGLILGFYRLISPDERRLLVQQFIKPRLAKLQGKPAIETTAETPARG